ncbi:MAG TPA: chemotaxis response regulator protein-glutamate methylesterase [Geobacteraceae bacterium]|nr:chemotaxis response regulator protein-glutamate methylesterase [Geobacteraceae bacterium]
MSQINSTKKVRVLIVDDSSFMRMAIRGILDRDPDLEVIGSAIDGADGVKKAMDLRPDIITMDIEMPRMDGISALREIMAKSPTRVIMVSTLTNEGAKATFEALEAGAVDYIPKNITDSSAAQKVFKEELLQKVKAAAMFAVPKKSAPTIRSAVPEKLKPAASRLKPGRISCVAIGASTGGPIALQEVLSRIPVNFPHGIMVAIHMPRAFTGPYAERLNAKCSLSIKEAADGDILRPGTALIAPGGKHSSLVRQSAGLAVRTAPIDQFPGYIYIPSVDIMMSSMADVAGGSVLGVILTGMGNDGFKGMKHIKEKGGATLVQDEATSTIYGMPKACIQGGIADLVLPLDQIGFEIAKIAERNDGK